MLKNKLYSKRSDLEKIQANWKKAQGLISRREYSLSVVRVATMLELTTNAIVRKELKNQFGLPEKFIDHLLIWANGIHGKWNKILIPLHGPNQKVPKLRILFRKISKINEERNKVVHSGEFTDKDPAKKIAKDAKGIVNELFEMFEINYELKDSLNLIQRRRALFGRYIRPSRLRRAGRIIKERSV